MKLSGFAGIRFVMLSCIILTGGMQAFATISYVGITDSSYDDGVTSLTVRKPSGTIEGDLLVALIGHQAEAARTISAPSGWTQFSGSPKTTCCSRSAMYYKIADSSEGSTYSFTVSSPGVGQNASVILAAYRGVDQDNPVEAAAGKDSSNSYTHPAPSASVTNSGCWGIVALTTEGCCPDTITCPTGLIQRKETAGGFKMEFADANGTISTGTWSPGIWTLSASKQATMHTIVLRAGEEDFGTWQYSKAIYLNTNTSGANVSSNVTNFPVLIRLDRTNFNFGEASIYGNDLRFGKNDTAFIPYQIEQWDAVNQVAQIWVKVDTVKGNDSTQYFTMYWGKSDADSRSDGSAVFDTANGYAGVWHMNPDLSQGSTGPISFIGSNDTIDVTGTSVTVRKPANTSQNDVLIAHIIASDDDASISPPSGWSQVSSSPCTTDYHRAAVFYKVAGSSEPSSYTFTTSQSATLAGIITSYRGANTSTPIEDDNAVISLNYVSSHASAQASVSTQGCWAVLCMSAEGYAGDVGAPSGYTEREEAWSPWSEIADSDDPVSTGTLNPGTWTTDQNKQSIAYTIILKPAGSAAPIYDATANTVDGTAHGSMTQSAVVDAVAGKGLSFDGADDYIDLGNGSSVDITGSSSLTLYAWVRFDSLNSSQYVDFFGKGDHQYLLQKRNTDNKVWNSLYDGSSWHEPVSDSAMVTNRWYLVTGVYNGSNDSAFIYVNGVKQANRLTCPSISSTRNDALQMGRNSEVASRYLKGRLDEVRLLRTAAGDAYVRLSYENQKPNQTLVSMAPYIENYAQWPYSKRIYFNTTSSGANISDSITNFNYLVKLTADDFNIFQASANGSDIRFSDADGTQLPYQIDFWDIGNRKAEIWVKVPKINGNSMSDYITLHYGRYGIADRQNNKAVWDSTYAAVYHLNELPIGDSIGIVKDVSNNHNDGTPQASMTAGHSLEGTIGKADEFDGANDLISVPDDATLDITVKLSISAWVRFDAITASQYGIVSKKGSGTNAWGFFAKKNGDSLQLAIRLDASNTTVTSTVNAKITLGKWHHVGMIFDNAGDSVVFYADGVKLGSKVTCNQSPVNTATALEIGAEGGNDWFDGRIDEVQIANVVRSAGWFKFSYENQRPDKSMQMTDLTALSPIWDGTLKNKASAFVKDSATMVMKYGANPVADSIKYGMMQFDLTQARELQRSGWALENANLEITADSIATPRAHDSLYFGIYSGDRFLPSEREDGLTAWTEDRSNINGGRPITMNQTVYAKGLGGQPTTTGGYSWLLFDVQSELARLGIGGLADSMTGYFGKQDSATSVDLYVKTSTQTIAPSESCWINGGTGVTPRISTSGNQQNVVINNISLANVKWIWLGMNCDTNAYGVWGNLKLHVKTPRTTQMLVFGVKSDSINPTGINFTNRNSSAKWRHSSVEEDGVSDSAEGIGTEDLTRDGYWNRYKGKYRSRSPLASYNINPRSFYKNDTATYYFGVYGPNRILPWDIQQGYYDFLEDKSTNNADTIEVADTAYYTGIGGSPKDGSGNHSYLIFNLASEKARLGLGRIISLTGTAAHQDGSASIEVFVKTDTATAYPSASDWINNSGSVVERAHKETGQQEYGFNLTTNGLGGGEGSINDVKWVWISCKTTTGNGSTAFAVWPNLRLNTRSKGGDIISLSSSKLSTAVAEALEKASGDEIDSTGAKLTLFTALTDSGTARMHASEAADYLVRPKLRLSFSDSRTMLSWQGRNDSLDFPIDSTITLVGNPSLGDGRFDRVVRFHDNSQKAYVKDSTIIDYSEGSLSFWYQKTGENSDAADAVFFRRASADSTWFKLGRTGTQMGLYFLYGDTSGDSTGSNMMQWAFIDSFKNPADTTQWLKDTIVNPFDGAQHLIQFIWNYATTTFRLLIDGKSPYTKLFAAPSTLPSLWYRDTLVLGEKIDGYIENLVIRSKQREPQPITVAQQLIDTIPSYLPYIQPEFKNRADMIVISPNDDMMEQELERYAQRNSSMGIRTVVVRIDEISKAYTGSDIQERIRNFLKYAYKKWQPRWSLLGGSALLIPQRKVSFEAMEEHTVSTDRYFACLEGTWNDDGDEFFAEPEDNYDMTAELMIGRFPADNWSELHSMIEKSSMAMGLPPYGSQCLVNIDTIALTGIQMFNNIGNISDGQYYAKQLKSIIATGAYTSSLGIKEYYPSDDTANTRYNTTAQRLKKFLDTLQPMPGMWIHYGHGLANEVMLDFISVPDTMRKFMVLEMKNVQQDTMFNKFRRMSHYRFVACETGSQDVNSLSRILLASPYGGALTFIGTADYSYPVVENQLLQEELKAIADSSLFSWGEVYKRAADVVLAQSGRWDIANWVILSRNFLGDPLLPVRTNKISQSDTLQVVVNPSSISTGQDTVTVTVKDKNGNAVEGAQVGLLTRKITAMDDSVRYYQVTKDLAFAGGSTNKNGRIKLPYRVSFDDTVAVTAAHQDFRSSRTIVPVNLGAANALVVDYKMEDSPRIGEIPPDTNGHLKYPSWMMLNRVFEPGESLKVTIRFTNMYSDTVTNLIMHLDPDTADSTGIKLAGWDVACDTFGMVNPGHRAQFWHGCFAVSSCPPGVRTLRMKLSYDYYLGAAHHQEMMISYPITGPAVTPVIQFLVDPQTDTIIWPEANTSVRLKITLGNRFPSTALGVKCKLFDVDDDFIDMVSDTTDTTYSVGPYHTADDTSIAFYIGTYSENANGLLLAKLAIEGRNMQSETLAIDLNPIRGLNLQCKEQAVSVSYDNGVYLEWNPLRYQEGFGRRSDLLGYVVIRRDSVESDTSTEPISFIGSKDTINVTGTSFVVSKPANTAQNDVMVAHIIASAYQSAISAPTGWTQISSSPCTTNYHRAAVFYKVAGSSEPSSYTFTVSSSATLAGMIGTYRGVNTTSPVEDDNAAVDFNYQTSHASAQVSVNTTGCWAVLCMSGEGWAGDIGAPSGYEEREESWSPWGEIADSDDSVSTGTLNPGTWTTDQGKQAIAFTIALKPAAVIEENATTVMLTPSPITATNYYDDKLPDTNVATYIYTVFAVDSSFNYSTHFEKAINRPNTQKKGFPIVLRSLMHNPFTGDWDKDGKAEIYSVSSTNHQTGSPIGFRSNGQEASVQGRNDGIITGRTDVWQIALADMDGDGFDDAVLATKDSLITYSIKTGAVLNRALVRQYPHDTTADSKLWFLNRPVIADVNNDGKFEIVIYGMDNLLSMSSTAMTLEVFDNQLKRLGKFRFIDAANFSSAPVVGNFYAGANLEIIVAGLDTLPVDSPDVKKFKLFLFTCTSDTLNCLSLLDNISICPWPAMTINTGISIGNLWATASLKEIVVGKGKMVWGDPNARDTLMVIGFDTSNGRFVENTIAQIPVNFSMATVHGSIPALADIADDGTDDIVFATDDSLYLFKMALATALTTMAKVRFGSVPANRLVQESFTPQPLVADIDNDGKLEIVVNHQGDGKIWAYKVYSEDSLALCDGYPLRTQGKVDKACEITDLEGDDTLDLVAADEAGMLYAWKLGKGSIYAQPWPSKYGNNWNTCNSTFKSTGITGFVYEDWKAARVPPYSWKQTGVDNSISESSGYFVRADSMIYTDSASDRNCHFIGPNTENWVDYTIQGKIKWDNANATPGINFYSQWPDTAMKYMISRATDGTFKLRRYTNYGAYTTLATGDTVLDSSGVWYNYKLKVEKNGNANKIKVAFWLGNDDPTLTTGYTWPQMSCTDSSGLLTKGTVGFCSHSGSGRKYWGPVTVTSNYAVSNAYMAYEDFQRDSIVDVRPYTPADWYTDWQYTRLDTSTEVFGFVLDTTDGATPNMYYRHVPGITYPVGARIAPYNNLGWKNYEYRGKIKKPAGAVYDTMAIGVKFYMESPTDYYILKVSGFMSGSSDNNQFKLYRHTGSGEDLLTTLNYLSFSGDTDSVWFAIQVQTRDTVSGGQVVKDGKTVMKAKVWDARDIEREWPNYWTEDNDMAKHKKQGYPGVFIDYTKVYGSIPYSNKISLSDFKAQAISQ
ncbi:transport protein ExbB2 [sediment metagenome]|uniref:Transport protein ExbB2 n=1 Tax=sediment metagenome TaxID=749907 RepID=D9PHJ6_9ZZZZ